MMSRRSWTGGWVKKKSLNVHEEGRSTVPVQGAPPLNFSEDSCPVINRPWSRLCSRSESDGDVNVLGACPAQDLLKIGKSGSFTT